jgi:hypothetical protein
VALLVGAVNNEVAPVWPIATLFGKLGVSAVIVAASSVSTAFVQLGHDIETVNEFDNFEFTAVLNAQLTWQEYTSISAAFVGETVRVAVDPLIANEFVKVAAVGARQVPSQVLTFEQAEHLKQLRE